MPRERSEAEDTVFGNLGLTDEDLGGGEGNGPELPEDDQEDEGAAANDADEGAEGQDEGEAEGEEGEEELDDLSARGPRDNQERRAQRNQQPQGKLVRNRDGNIIREGTTIDKRGNVVEQGTGRIIARAGKERTFYNQANTMEYRLGAASSAAEKFRQDVIKAVEIGQALGKQLQELREQRGVGDALGLNAEEQNDAMQLASMAKKDPQQFVRTVLTRAAAQGIDLSSLGLKGGIDPASLTALIREEIGKATKPFNEEAQRRSEEAAQREQRDTVSREVTDFFEQNPDAQPFIPVFEKALADPRTSHMSLNEIWLNIQLANARQGGGSEPRRDVRPSPSNRGLPNGRARPSGAPQRETMASLDQSYDDILNDVLATTGIT